jgi:hypothetical protein
MAPGTSGEKDPFEFAQPLDGEVAEFPVPLTGCSFSN